MTTAQNIMKYINQSGVDFISTFTSARIIPYSWIYFIPKDLIRHSFEIFLIHKLSEGERLGRSYIID